MVRLSANGKRLGRPPGTPTATLQPDAQTLAIAKAMQTFRARYDAAGRGRRMTGWNAPSSGPNAAMQGLQTIRDRSRDASRNDWAGESGIQKWTTSLVGIGITPRFKRIKSKTVEQLKKDTLAEELAKALGDPSTASQVAEAVFSNRKVAEKEVLKKGKAQKTNE